MKLKRSAIVAALILVLCTTVIMRYAHEFIPLEETVTPIFSIDVELMEQLEYVGVIEFPYSGRYRIWLDLLATDLNTPPRAEDLKEQQFVLQGQVRLADSEETILTKPFAVTIDNTHVGTGLLQIEVQRSLFSSQKTIYIEFEEPDPGFEHYFSSGSLYIRYRPRFPILD